MSVRHSILNFSGFFSMISLTEGQIERFKDLTSDLRVRVSLLRKILPLGSATNQTRARGVVVPVEGREEAAGREHEGSSR